MEISRTLKYGTLLTLPPELDTFLKVADEIRIRKDGDNFYVDVVIREDEKVNCEDCFHRIVEKGIAKCCIDYPEECPNEETSCVYFVNKDYFAYILKTIKLKWEHLKREYPALLGLLADMLRAPVEAGVQGQEEVAGEGEVRDNVEDEVENKDEVEDEVDGAEVVEESGNGRGWYDGGHFKYRVSDGKLYIKQRGRSRTFDFDTVCRIYNDLPEECAYRAVVEAAEKHGLSIRPSDARILMHVFSRYVTFDAELNRSKGGLILRKQNTDGLLREEARKKLEQEKEVIGSFD